MNPSKGSDMTNNAIVTLKVVGFDTCIHVGYLNYGMYEVLGRKLEDFLRKPVVQASNGIPNRYADVDDIINFLSEDGGVYFHSIPESIFAPYRYYIEVDEFGSYPIIMKFGSRDLHWKRKSDTRFEEEPDNVLYNRVKHSEAVFYVKG